MWPGVWNRSWSWSPQKSGFWPLIVESLTWRRLRLQAISVASGLLCNFVAVYLYTIVHFLLEEFKNFSRVILKYTIITSHNKSESRSWSLILGRESESKSRFFSAGVGVWSSKFSNPGVGVGVPQKQGLHISGYDWFFLRHFCLLLLETNEWSAVKLQKLFDYFSLRKKWLTVSQRKNSQTMQSRSRENVSIFGRQLNMGSLVMNMKFFSIHFLHWNNSWTSSSWITWLLLCMLCTVLVVFLCRAFNEAIFATLFGTCQRWLSLQTSSVSTRLCRGWRWPCRSSVTFHMPSHLPHCCYRLPTFCFQLFSV